MDKINKADELFGLHKIPDSILIQKLLEERGKNLSYIEELEEELGRSSGCTKCRMKEEQIKALEKKNRKLTEKAEREEETFKARYYTLLKKYEVLEKQMIKMLKNVSVGEQVKQKQ